MLVEQRTYTTHLGKWRDYLALYEAEGLEVQARILGRMVGYYTVEFGTLNQIVHMWAYENLDEREQRRTALLAHPLWQSYVRKMMPMLVSQESRILKPASFFLPQWQAPIAQST